MRRGKCVGIAIHKQTLYYAISGDDANLISNKVAMDVEKIISKKSIRCTIDNTFTMIAYINEHVTEIIKPYYKFIEDCIYSDLLINGKTSYTFIDYLDSRIYFKPFMRKIGAIHSIRNYSCVERKIIGKVRCSKIKIYVGTNPCYYCLPIVRNVVYLSREKKRLTRLSVFKYRNKFTFR